MMVVVEVVVHAVKGVVVMVLAVHRVIAEMMVVVVIV